MNTLSRSTLFLIEQLIAIVVFALCAAACITILAAAYFSAEETRNTKNALLVAENAAEAFKATGGDLEEVASILGGVAYNFHSADENVIALELYYDDNWQASNFENAAYILVIWLYPESISNLAEGRLVVAKGTSTLCVGFDEILSFPVAARTGGGSR